jgi:hypothetical protein
MGQQPIYPVQENVPGISKGDPVQTIKTKNHGNINFIKTWVDGNIHIGLTDHGDYRHIGGPIVEKRSDLNVISDINHLQTAEDWFDNTYNKPPIVNTPKVAAEQAHEAAMQAASELSESALSAVSAGAKLTHPDRQEFAHKLKEVLPKSKLTDVKVCPICKKETNGALGLKSHMRTHASDVDENKRDTVEIIE